MKMKRLFSILLLPTLLVVLFSFVNKKQTADEYANEYVVFAGASGNFHDLDSVAKKISRATAIEYRNDLVYDSKRGMIVPDTSDDELYAGTYFPRRYAEERISIEMAGYYKKGTLRDADSTEMMTIVTGIFGEKKDAVKHLEKIKKVVPSAYMKKLRLYQGCMH